MAEIEPLRALHYDPARTGGLQDVVAPPYDVIDDAGRAALLAGSAHNVVEIDLPRAPEDDGDAYEHAARTLHAWREDGVVVLDEAPAIWTLAQEYTGPDGERRTRQGSGQRRGRQRRAPGQQRASLHRALSLVIGGG